MLLTRTWGAANNEYAVLSAVPPDISVLDREGDYYDGGDEYDGGVE